MIMLFHLFIFFSLMNWSIPSYSAGKLTIRIVDVYIVIQCHSQSNMQKLVLDLSSGSEPERACIADGMFLSWHTNHV